MYTKLEAAGYKASWVRANVLPNWWEDKMANQPSLLQQAQIIVSKFFDVPLREVLDPYSPLPAPDMGHVSFKRLSHATSANMGPVFLTVTRAAEIAERCVFPGFPNNHLAGLSSEAVRISILQTFQSVTFEALIDSCWGFGVPVIHVRGLPPGIGCEIEGAAFNVTGRPVIIITATDTSASFLRWILAHEMGHIAHRHVDGGPIFDAAINSESDDSDIIENEANQWASDLVFGRQDSQPFGHVLPTVAGAALGAESVVGKAITDRMRRHMDSLLLTDVDAHFFAQVCGLSDQW